MTILPTMTFELERGIYASASDGDEPGDDSMGGQGAVVAEPETKKKLAKPKQYKVLLHNDDYTTMEFVIMVLIRVFHHTEATAAQIMLHVHNNGVGTAGVYSYEVAESKANKTMMLAREHDYPLRTSVEQA